MKPFEPISAPACPLGLVDVDTGQLIPARFMQTPRSEGYGKFLLHDLRRDGDGGMLKGFALNDERYGAARTMIAGRNFGCGSSREAAVYVLVDQGFACVVAPSFGDIFASNAAKNGLLAAVVSEADEAALMADRSVIAGESIQVDLETQTITTPDRKISFEIRADRKLRLLNGWSDLDLTRSHHNEIGSFVEDAKKLRPWAGAPDLSLLGRPQTRSIP